jgi:hypothetical protein
MAYIGNDVDAIFIPSSVNTSTDLRINGGALTQTGGDVNLDGGTFFLDEANNRVGINTVSPSVALDVVGDLTVSGNLTISGTTTTISTQTLLVEDKNIELGVVGTPSNATADGGGITLKGTTDKTINWVDATDAWTFSEHVNIASAKEYRIAGTKVLDATSLGSGVTGSSLTSVGTIATGTWQGTAIDKTYLDATLVSTGDTGTVTSTMITDGTIVNADINASAGIVDTKLATISTAGKVSNSATTAVSTNTVNAIVTRDGSGNFSAGTITANLTGTASAIADNTVTSAKIVDGAIVNVDVNASAAIAGTKISPNFGSQTITTTGVISPALGTAAAPSIAFTGDLNTGIYSPGADQVAVATNGVRRLFVNASGQVGIGTSAGLEGSLTTADAVVVRRNTDGWIFKHKRTDDTQEVGFQSVGHASTVGIAAFTGGTERLRITSAGLVGIGTSSPANRLDVDGAVGIAYGGASGGLRLRLNTATVNNSILQHVFTGGVGDVLEVAPAGDSPGSAIAFRTASSSTLGTRMFITSSGNVGIGTSSPGALLETSSNASDTLNGEVLLQRIRSNAVNSVVLDIKSRRHTAGSSWTGVGFRLQHQVDSTQMGFIEFNSINSSRNLVLGTDGNSRLLITSAGNVGIGTTSPNYLLEVNGASGSSSEIALTSAAFQRHIIRQGGTGDGGVQLINQTTGSERARIDSSGRLLVGTSTARTNFNNTADATALQVEATSFVGASLSLVRNVANASSGGIIIGKTRGASVGSNTLVANGDSLGAITWQGADGTNMVIAASIGVNIDAAPGTNNMPGRLVFSTTAAGASSPTERMRIAQEGHILIGQTTTSIPGLNNTTLGGAIEALGDNSRVLFLSRSSGATLYLNRNENGAVAQFQRSGTSVGSIAVTTTNTAYNTSSDYRLKENVVDLDGAIDRLNQLPVHRFNFIADPDTVVDGFIAHEAAEVVPECVTGTKDEVDDDGNPVYQGIDQSKLVPLLTAALQEAIGEIESLKARVVALESA